MLDSEIVKIINRDTNSYNTIHQRLLVGIYHNTWTAVNRNGADNHVILHQVMNNMDPQYEVFVSKDTLSID